MEEYRKGYRCVCVCFCNSLMRLRVQLRVTHLQQVRLFFVGKVCNQEEYSKQWRLIEHCSTAFILWTHVSTYTFHYFILIVEPAYLSFGWSWYLYIDYHGCLLKVTLNGWTYRWSLFSGDNIEAMAMSQMLLCQPYSDPVLCMAYFTVRLCRDWPTF